MLSHATPPNTRCNENVIITSKRHFDVITSKLPPVLRDVSAGTRPLWCLVYLGKYGNKFKIVYLLSEHQDCAGSYNHPSRKKIMRLTCIVHTVVTDDLAAQGAIASAAIVLTKFFEECLGLSTRRAKSVTISCTIVFSPHLSFDISTFSQEKVYVAHEITTKHLFDMIKYNPILHIAR